MPTILEIIHRISYLPGFGLYSGDSSSFDIPMFDDSVASLIRYPGRKRTGATKITRNARLLSAGRSMAALVQTTYERDSA